MGEPASIQPVEARPPTPPRESDRTNLRSSLPESVAPKSSRRSSRSSHITPDSSLESSNNTSASNRKRVGWAASAEYSDAEASPRQLSPLLSSAAPKPLKSILKAYNGPQEHEHDHITANGAKLLPPHQHPNFATMLASIVQQISAGNERLTKMEAYIMLSSSLKASEVVPDVKALKTQISTICSIISQDITSKIETARTDTGVVLRPDSVLIVNALMLLASFMQKPIVAESFPLDFQANFVEYTIKAFTDNSATKEIIRHLMFLMGQQNFSPKVMNQDRIGRLISVLHTLEQQVKGKSVVTGRLQVYRNLLRRSRGHMLVNTEWMQDLFVDMRSSNKDIQSSAITFGLESSLMLGTESGATRALTKLFDMEYNEGTCFADFYALSLKAMVKKRDEGPAVPQIWSVIILFLRANPALYEKWRFMKLFFDVLSDCWNSGDSSIKCEANYAWNRYIYARQLSENTIPTARARLFQPLITQIKERRSRSARKSALNSIYYLLYYAFSPNSTSLRLDLYWDEYVKPLMMDGLITDNIRETSEIAKSDIDEACAILRCLFDTSRQRPWNENRVFETPQQNIMSVKELPALDAKWLRSRVTRVVPILSSLLEKVFWELGADDSPITELLQTYLRTISLPAKMEIKVSNDTMKCIASLFGIIHKIWTAGRLKISSLPQSRGPHGPNTSAAFLRCFEKIITTTTETLGLLPFTEKLLSISHNTFIAVATPSQQPKKIRGEIKCPLNHLILFLMTISPDLEYDQGFSSMVHRILQPFFEACKSPTLKRELVRDLFNLLPDTPPTPSSVLVWQVLAEFASLATDFRDEKEVSKPSEEPLGANYRETIKILEAGHRYSPFSPLPKWKLLFEALVTSSSLDAGDAGRAVAVIEPVANFLISKDKKICSLGYLHILLAKATYPKDRQALDIARKRMWGTAHSSQRSAAFDPYTFLYEYIQVSLESSYESFAKQNIAMYTDIINALSSLLTRCPEPLLLGVLMRIQNGIACWISDSKSHLTGGSVLLQAVGELWSIISNSITRIVLSQKHAKLLNDLEVLICCGLESKHKAIVTTSIQSWNSASGSSKEQFQYPDRVKSALARLYPVADLLLPFFPDSLENELSANQAQRVEFAETQNDSIYPGVSSTDSFLKLRPSYTPGEQISPTTKRLRQTTPQVIIASARSSSLRKRSREATPDARVRPRKKRATTPKARHDDSQVQFEAVQSSPIADRMGESQLLTEKQRDNRERQRAEAGIFRDLRFSPRTRESPAKIQATEDPELPLHRSMSRSRSRSQSRHSQEMPRATTPTLVLPSDDDHFITSSPTPTHSVRDLVENRELPASSPPESVAKKRPGCGEQLTPSMLEPIVSSDAAWTSASETNQSLSVPPKTAALNGEERSLDPSAQVNPFAFPVSLTSTAWDSTGGVRYSSPSDDPSDQLRADASQQHGDTADDELELRLPPRTQEGTPLKDSSIYPTLLSTIENPRVTRTPARNVHKSPLGDKSLRATASVDVTTTSLSSDINGMSEDVYEDAVSSPQPHVNEGKDKDGSSPISEGEERSIMRMMAGFDQDSSQNFWLKQVTQNQGTAERILVPNTSSADAVSSVQKLVSSNNATTGKLVSVQISSGLSRIPETPAPKLSNTKAYFDSDGEEVDMSQTIIVDDADMVYKRLNTGRRAGRSPAKKRKHNEVQGDSNEVPDSQENGKGGVAYLESSTTPQKKSPAKREPPAKKSRKSLSRQTSQVSLASETSFELDASKEVSPVKGSEQHTATHGVVPRMQQSSQPNLSSAVPSASQPIATKLDDVLRRLPQATRPSTQPLRVVGMEIATTQAANAIQFGADTDMQLDVDEPASEAAPAGKPELAQTPSHDDNDNDESPAGQQQTNLERDAAAINGTTEDVASKASEIEPTNELNEATLGDESEQLKPADVTGEQSRGEILAPEKQAAVDDQTQPEDVQPSSQDRAASTLEKVRSAMQSIYDMLPSMKLTKKTISSLEDDLIDIKSELYAAGARGRGLEEDEMVDE